MTIKKETEENILKEIEEPKRDISYWIDYWKKMKKKGCNNFDFYIEIYEAGKQEAETKVENWDDLKKVEPYKSLIEEELSAYKQNITEMVEEMLKQNDDMVKSGKVLPKCVRIPFINGEELLSKINSQRKLHKLDKGDLECTSTSPADTINKKCSKKTNSKINKNSKDICMMSKEGYCNSDYNKFKYCDGINVRKDCPYKSGGEFAMAVKDYKNINN